jgi:hypothetical protein
MEYGREKLRLGAFLTLKIDRSEYLLALAAVTPLNTTQYSSYWRLGGPKAGLDAIEKSKTLGP